MRYYRLLGTKLQYGKNFLESEGYKVKILKTKGLNKNYNIDLRDSRVLRIDIDRNNATIISGDF
ncbi:hypothetical protein [Clostridiisalibacter paucivorans]|uniref:hypothetical protein n=1 Tax=Clostridiisalibacter paucivorans TaxID=408753 RepID=UPI00047CCC0C|nr:hypothetical protein [Clostridiisalibacter paucivorans]